MRTTIDLEDDVLSAAKELAIKRGTTVGRVLSDLVRQSLTRHTPVFCIHIILSTSSPINQFTSLPIRGTIPSFVIYFVSQVTSNWSRLLFRILLFFLFTFIYSALRNLHSSIYVPIEPLNP